MSKSSANSGDTLDLEQIRRLAELMNEQQLSEVTVVQGATRLRLRRGPIGAPAFVAPAAAAPAPASAAASPASSAPSADDAKLHVIKSPMVGTFYTSSSPDSPAFVRVGDHVGPESTVCIVEAMKVFNEIPAEVSGKIVAVLVENGEPVEFGQPLFKVDSGK